MDYSLYKTLTAKEAAKYLNIGRIEDFNSIVNSGQIGYLQVGKRKKFTIEGLEAWRLKLNFHTDYTREVTSTGRTSRLSMKTKSATSLEQLQIQERIKRLNSLSSKKLQAYKSKLDTKPQVNCLV